MIIFTNNPNILGLTQDPVIFNLSSYQSGYYDITNLATNMPINQNIPTNEYIYMPDFDINYMNMIFSNDVLFISLMKIMINLYEGKNVIVLISRDEYRDAITESLIKLIQQRYGYNCWLIENLEDMECVRESSFTSIGILTLDNDRKRYMSLFANGGIEYIGDTIPREKPF